MKNPVLLLLASVFLSSSVFTSTAESSQALQLHIMPRGLHVDINKLLDQLPVKDMSELPAHGLSLKHQASHPFGIIYHGVRYVEGYAKKIANDHHAQNKLAWFKGLVGHVRMTATQTAHNGTHEGDPILKASVDHLKKSLEDMVAKAPPEARIKLHEEGWKMIHDLVNELRPIVVVHTADDLENELSALKKLSGIIDKTESVPHKEELIKHLRSEVKVLNKKGKSLAEIYEAIPNAFCVMDDAALDKLMKENPDAAVKAIKAGEHHLTSSKLTRSCENQAQRKKAITQVAQ